MRAPMADPRPPRALSWPAARARRLWGSVSDRAAGPLLYAAAIALLAKLARAAELSVRVDSYVPFGALPLTLGQDLILVAAIGLAADALARLRHRGLALASLLLLLAPLALLLPADVVAHRLTGGPITWQRLRGDEGATLADLGLLSRADLAYGLGAIALCLAALYPALRLRPRARWLRAWARPRALLATMLAGFGLTLVQPLAVPRAQGLAEQPLFVLAASFVDPPELKPIVLGEAQWRALHRPRRELPPVPPPPPTAGKAKNVIIFLAEGIGFEHTGFHPGTVKNLKKRVAKELKKKKRKKRTRSDRTERLRASGDPTPNLSRRHARHGMLFDRYHANWHASIQAIFSIVCSSFPPMRGDIVRIKPRIDCGELSEVMREHGIATGLFHGGRFNFYNKLALLGQRGYEPELDAEDLARRNEHREHQWGIDDRAVAEATLRWIDTLPEGQRFAALLIPITAHYPYWTPHSFKRPFPKSGRRLRFLNAVAFQDDVVEQILRGLEKRKLYDDTLFVWLGDHGHYVGEPARKTPGLRGFYQPNLHVPLLFINPTMFPEDGTLRRRSSRLGGHRDLLPTILEALGLPPDPRHQGQSLLGADYEHRRQFFAADNGRYVGFIEGHHKFALEPRANRVEYYDLAADPDERKDLSEEDPSMMRRYADDALLFARAVEGRIETAETLREEVSVAQVYELFMQRAKVRVRPPKPKPEPGAGPPKKGAQASPGPIDCERDGDEIECPGLSPLHVKLTRIQGERRRCVMVPVPPEGSIELEITDPDTFRLMRGTIVAMPRKGNKKARFRIATRTDGRSDGSVTLTHQIPVRPRHPLPEQSLSFTLSRRASKRPLPLPDGGAPPPPKPPGEVMLCLQLTTLVP